MHFIGTCFLFYSLLFWTNSQLTDKLFSILFQKLKNIRKSCLFFLFLLFFLSLILFIIVFIYLPITCNYGCKLEVLLLYKIIFFSHRVSTGKKMGKIKMIIKPLKKKRKPKMNRRSLWVLSFLLSAYLAVPLPI